MEIIRSIESLLYLWKSKATRKPLIVRGARQVGKSTTIAKFGLKNFSNTVTINFEKRPDFAKCFTQDLDPQRIIAELEVKSRSKILPGATLVFFDEIQECPQAITALRYFFEEMPKLHVIAAGSLLEFAFENISVPVGRIEFIWMYPLSFSEFLSATSRDKLAMIIPKMEFQKEIEWKLSETIVVEFYKALREYFIVGGMPEAVRTYIETKSYAAVDEVLDNIVATFLLDTNKYAKGEKQIANLSSVLRRIYRFIGQEITYTTLGEGDNSQRTAASLKLLERAMLCHIVRSTSPSSLPLSGGASEKHFKCILLDIGFARRLAALDANELLSNPELLSVHEGRAAEQFIGQNLLAESGKGSEGGKLYCWIRPQKSAKAEVDYLLSRQGKIIPVEIKSGSTGRLRSLAVLLNEYPQISLGLCLKEVSRPEQRDKILSLPLFTIVI
ncbi:MAG: ATP-binding protein [Oligoflexales bacterium]|nr:ATP-binding protein [Oligoflexales bacterium]